MEREMVIIHESRMACCIHSNHSAHPWEKRLMTLHTAKHSLIPALSNLSGLESFAIHTKPTSTIHHNNNPLQILSEIFFPQSKTDTVAWSASSLLTPSNSPHPLLTAWRGSFLCARFPGPCSHCYDWATGSLTSPHWDTSSDCGHFIPIIFSNGPVPASGRGLVAEAIIHSREKERIKPI